MKIEITLSESDLRTLVLSYLEGAIGPSASGKLKPEDVLIEVKSKQNYKSEWEPAAWRARIEANKP